MVVIGYDRYNVICKGFNGTKITPVIAFFVILAIWIYAVGVCCPPFLGWGGYALGKFLTDIHKSCGKNFKISIFDSIFDRFSTQFLTIFWPIWPFFDNL